MGTTVKAPRVVLPPIDWQAVRRLAGDLRKIVEADIGPPDRSKKWPCPFHSERTPSLSVGSTNFYCFGCQAKGDAVDWLMGRRGLSRIEAAELLGWKPTLPRKDGKTSQRGRISTPAPAPPPEPPRPRAWQDIHWQVAVNGIVGDCERRLWGPAGRAALDWLQARGLADDTIRRFRLGFRHDDHWSRAKFACLAGDDGQPRGIYIPRGITIPWLRPGSWYAADSGPDDDEPGERWVGVNVRRLAPDVNAPLPPDPRTGKVPEKCQCLKGSTRGYLYPEPDVLPTQGQLPALIVEGEFDALIGQQELGPWCHVVTAGSASVSRLPRESRAALARCPVLLLAFDHDAAGVEAARQWRGMFPHKARRVLLPTGKDLTDFVRQGGDVRAWLREQFDRLSEGGPAHP